MNGFTQKTFASFLLVLILLIVNIQAAWRSQQIQLSPDQFSKLQGGSSFWKNPCTVDGFLFGISAIADSINANGRLSIRQSEDLRHCCKWSRMYS